MMLVLAVHANADATNARPCDNGAGPPNDSSQAGYDERLVGVCHLENSDNRIEYKGSSAEQGEITFGVRSCSPELNDPACTYATPYSVRISGPTRGNSFSLTGPWWCSGNKNLPIILTYINTGNSEALSPDQDSSTLFSGGANGQLIPSSILVKLAPGAQLRCGYYSGEFTLSIDQCGQNDFGGAFPCDGSKSTTKLAAGEEIHFSIELWQDEEIQISGLEDMNLTAGGSQAAEASQDFCVYGSSLLFGVLPWSDSALFRVTASSLNGKGTGSFILHGVDDLTYEVELASTADGYSESLQEGVTSNTRWRGHGEVDCANYTEENMRITVRVPKSQLDGANGTTYTDILTLTVELE